MRNLHNRIALTALVLVPLLAKPQPDPPADLLYLGPVSLLFYSERHYTEPSRNNAIYISPGLLRMTVGVRPPSQPALAVVQHGSRPLLEQASLLWLQVATNTNAVVSRRLLCPQGYTIPCDSATTDISWHIEADSIYRLTIGLQGMDSALMELVITGRWAPAEMEGWRELDQPDPLFEHMASLSQVLTDSPPTPLFKKPGPYIQPSKTGYIQFKMRPAPPWADTLWEYSWAPLGANQAAHTWQPAGRLFTLPFEGHQQWLLRVRSMGQPVHQEFRVQVTPPWYRQPLVVALAILLLPLMAGHKTPHRRRRRNSGRGRYCRLIFVGFERIGGVTIKYWRRLGNRLPSGPAIANTSVALVLLYLKVDMLSF